MQDLSASGLLEFCGPGEISWSYAQRAYVPGVPSVGLLRSANLLYATLAHEGELERVRPLVDSVRAEFGLERTVWGVKFQEQKVTWEFYWYDHSDEVPLTVSRVYRALEPYLHLPDLSGDWTEPIWSISVDIDSEVLDSSNVRGVHVYLPRSVQPPVCMSYFLGSDGLRLENTYFLFQDHDDPLSASIDWLDRSFHGVGHRDLLDKSWFPLDHVALAHKPARDGLYLGALPPPQAIDFLCRAGTPAWAYRPLQDPEGRFDHLLIDVAADLQRGEDGEARVVRSAYHGVI